jgi:hypothetical protein
MDVDVDWRPHNTHRKKRSHGRTLHAIALASTDTLCGENNWIFCDFLQKSVIIFMVELFNGIKGYIHVVTINEEAVVS